MPRNEAGVHSRCPQCQTVFRVTAAQLKVRDGMVRCGRCQHVFRADRHLVYKPAKGAVKPASAVARKRAALRKISAPEIPPAPAAPFFPAESLREEASARLTPRARLRTRTIYWAAGSTLLILLLAGQSLIFYGYSAARQTPMLRPVVDALCEPRPPWMAEVPGAKPSLRGQTQEQFFRLPCRKLPPIDMRRMDLVESRVAPHPRYDKALRVKATLVNRAEGVQPYPMIEVSLMDSQGQLVARRAYRPQEYLNKPEAIQQGLSPQVAVNVQLDITSPGTQASGYEVLLLPPPE